MKFLVLGGTRFLGRHLVEAAVERGHTVTTFTRGQAATHEHPAVLPLGGDRDPDKGAGLAALASGTWDAAFDTSGYVPRIVERTVAAEEHEQVVARDQLTTLMVTHSMHQAASLGDRLIMMHRGQIIHDFQGAEKRRLRPDDLLARFEEVRRAEQLDESAAEMLAAQYV